MQEFMQEFQELFQEPEGKLFHDYQRWFQLWADWLLGNCWLMVGGKKARLAEIEFYFAGPNHEDLFAHRHPVQQTPGAWYFHRSGNTYKNGTYKGLDLSFGNPQAFGGILIRSLVTEEVKMIDGPALCVDYILRQTNFPTVAALDAHIAGRPAWDPSSPLHFRPTAAITRRVYSCARVGLTLKKAKQLPTLPRFICLPYRFLTEPQRIKKGRSLLLLGLHIAGFTPNEIHALTRSPRSSIDRCLAAYTSALQAAQPSPNFQPLIGRNFTTDDLCQLHAVWQAAFGKQ